MSEVVKTFRVIRRQDMGGGVFREHGQLLPEAHLSAQTAHYVHQGALAEVEASVQEFVDAVRTYCPELAEKLADRVGARGQMQATGEVRASVMVPSSLPAHANDQTVSTPSLQRAILEAGRSHVSIRSEDNPEAAYAPVVGPLPQEEFQMVERSEGSHVYEDASTMDPAALNEALTNTRPEDVANHNPDAAYERPEPGPVSPEAPEHSFQDPIGSTPSGAVGPGAINPEGSDGGGEGAETDEGAEGAEGAETKGTSAETVETPQGERPLTTTDQSGAADEGITSGSDAELAAERDAGGTAPAEGTEQPAYDPGT